MLKNVITLTCLFFWLSIPIALPAGKSRITGEITTSANATHIARITQDSLIVVGGTTYSFTVDTPEDAGLVSTVPSVKVLLGEVVARGGTRQLYKILSASGVEKRTGDVAAGDRLIVTTQGGKFTREYRIGIRPMALGGSLRLVRDVITVNTSGKLLLHFTAGQRSPDATVQIWVPAGIVVTPENTTVNVIGRGEVTLKDLEHQSIGRVGSLFPYTKVGQIALTKSSDGTTMLTFSHLDLRPANGPDLVIAIAGVKLARTGKYLFKAAYSTSKPEVLTSPGTGSETAVLTATKTVSDFERVLVKDLRYAEQPGCYTGASFHWSSAKGALPAQIIQSLDSGKTWGASTAVVNNGAATISGLQPNKLYAFRLSVGSGENKGLSNIAHFYSGKKDIKSFGVSGLDGEDNTDSVNEAIAYLHKLGGGTLFFSKGIYSVRTIYLKSNVYLYVDKEAVIKAVKGGDEPEAAWFSDKKYRSGLSPTDMGPYHDPENYLTKQDVGHTYFRNAMFFGERLDNIKIIGNGYISGNGVLVTGDRVMNNEPGNRVDKMFALKLCTNVEIGGLYRPEDLWYDDARDEPYYIKEGGAADSVIDNMLHIDRGGHFVLLATGTDHIHVHDTYFGKRHTSNARDIYDFMACSHVKVTNVYSKVSSDDIVKPGSDCSLGFTRPATGYNVRNIIGDTNCNLFQIGSETADDITDVHVDNIYVLGANKAGFSISTNDGGHIKDIHLNCGHTGKVHSRSRMYRTFTPFFISISNRGRILGAEAGLYKFAENGEKHQELLVKNVNIGQVENVILNGIDVFEVYAGSSFRGDRWKRYDGSQRKATAIVAGYSLPDAVEGGYNFRLPNGKHTGYIKNIVFNDVNILVKGGNPLSDTVMTPPELGVGQYNASNLKVQPSYGLWTRHADGLVLKDCSFRYESRDGRYAIFLDDVLNATLTSVSMIRAKDSGHVIGFKKTSGVKLENVFYYQDEWNKSPTRLSQPGRPSEMNK